MRLLQIDAFTDQPFRGNPAAVCFLDRERESSWMQNVGAEMNLSETAFLRPRADGWSLRWFTPAVEVDLCGHATLASAHALWDEKLLSPDDTARFHTRSGVLTAVQSNGWIELDFPATPAQPAEAPADLLESIGISSPRFVGKNRFDYIIEAGSEEEVRKLNPHHTRLRRIPVRGVIVTSHGANGEYDFISRFFAPGSGIDEDPVTGSAHCCLTPYWAERTGKQELVAYQASRRGGTLRLRLAGDRVKIAGRAVTVLRGDLAA